MAKITLESKFELAYTRPAIFALNQLREEIEALCEPHNATQAAVNLVKLRHAQEEVSEIVDAIDRLNTSYCQHILPEIYERDEATSITVLDYRITKTETIKASVRDKEAAIDWLEKTGNEDIVDREPRINAQTLSAFARTLAEDGDLLPEEIFNVFQFTNTSVTKANRK